MPPNVKSPPLSISITLTPIRGVGGVRDITLKPGEPCLIGRSSKSTLKNLQSQRDNALFDCPVISREHAELRAHLWDLVENQVTITDKGSMHGTRVNGMKLFEGQPKTLRSGDTIQFGEKVTRAENSHDGVFVTFEHHHNLTQNSSTMPAHTQATNANTSGVYRYPYTSDEESDYGSDDNMSLLSDGDGGEAEHVSSAKTTPEQAKARLGSQELPIELDQPEQPKNMLIQDSLDTHGSIIVPESVPVPQTRMTHVDADDSDDDSIIVKQNTTPPTNAPIRPRAMSYASIESEADEQDDFEYPNIDATDHVDDVSDSDASELDHYSQAEEESDDEEGDEGPANRCLSPESAKEPSPELRSSGQPQSFAPLDVPSDPFMPSHRGALRNPFDQLPRPRVLPASQPSTYPNMYKPYAYQPFSGPSDLNPPMNNTSRFGAGGYRSLPTNSRWDKPPPPTFTRLEPTPFPNSYAPARDFYAPPADPFGMSQNWNDTPSYDVSSPFATMGSQSAYSPQSVSKPSQAVAPTTGRISIPDIVENETVTKNNTSTMADGNFGAEHSLVMEGMRMHAEKKAMAEEDKRLTDEAKAMNGKAADGASSQTLFSPASSGTKRKAADIEEATRVEFDSMLMDPANRLPRIETPELLALDNADVHAPAPKRAKTSATVATPTPTYDGSLMATTPTGPSAISVAVNIAKYTAAVSAGGVSMFAFLCSPASEQLMNWMSSM